MSPTFKQTGEPNIVQTLDLFDKIEKSVHKLTCNFGDIWRPPLISVSRSNYLLFADISFVVPVTNSITFLFTSLTSKILGETVNKCMYTYIEVMINGKN